MQRFLKTSLALIFALLQCIAPVAHAHISGGSADHGIHLPDIQLQYGHGASQLSGSAAVQESPAISAAQGFERNDEPASASSQTTYADFMPQPAAEKSAPHYRTPFHLLTLPSASSRKPYPQAPPAPLAL